ncbi:MAG: hypothetical protein LBI61_03180 [Puniceicoccales bacterium]|nr:hypothetical protein [Puniceicoccales bacterium]
MKISCGKNSSKITRPQNKQRNTANVRDSVRNRIIESRKRLGVPGGKLTLRKAQTADLPAKPNISAQLHEDAELVDLFEKLNISVPSQPADTERQTEIPELADLPAKPNISAQLQLEDAELADLFEKLSISVPSQPADTKRQTEISELVDLFVNLHQARLENNSELIRNLSDVIGIEEKNFSEEEIQLAKEAAHFSEPDGSATINSELQIPSKGGRVSASRSSQSADTKRQLEISELVDFFIALKRAWEEKDEKLVENLSKTIADKEKTFSKEEIRRAREAANIAETDNHAEDRLAQTTVDEYISSSNFRNLVDGKVSNFPQPAMPFAINESVVSARGSEERWSGFQQATGINPSDCGRKVVNMSGQSNLCGYRAILSQCDQQLAGNALSSGANEETSDETLKKVAKLRLAIAVGRMNNLGNIDVKSAKSFLLKEMNKLGPAGKGKADSGESCHGMLEVDDIGHIAKALGRRIVVVESSYGEVHDFNKEGEHICYAAGDVESLNGSGGGIRYERGDNREVLRQAMNEQNTIVLYNNSGVHFLAVQRITQ